MTRQSVRWIGGLLIAIIVAMATSTSFAAIARVVEDTGRELETQARIIAEQTARSVQAVDIVLRHIAFEFRRGRFSRPSPDELHAFLNEQVRLSRVSNQLTLYKVLGGGWNRENDALAAMM